MNRQLPLYALACLVVAAATPAGGGAPIGIPVDGTEPGPALYDPDPEHLWNRLHRALFLRVDGKGHAYGHDTVDPMLWPNTKQFLLTGPSHEKVISVLDEFIADDGHELIADPLKRAVLQHDLWAIFDWTANIDRPLPFGRRHEVTVTPQSTRARRALRNRLARAVSRLALGHEEIASLPNNWAMAGAAKAYPARYDEEHPQRPYLPPDLLDPDGSWVCVRGAAAGPSAPVHMEYYRGRSSFLVLLRLPGGRRSTLDYLERLNGHAGRTTSSTDWHKDLPLFPVGTAVALVRQMNVIDREGEIRATPLVQTLQMRVYRAVGEQVVDHQASQAMFKFTLHRQSLFGARAGGLEPVAANKRTGLSLLYGGDYFESDSMTSNRRVMQSCIDCHSCGGATAKSIFSFKQDDWVPAAYSMSLNSLRLQPSSIGVERERAVNWKSQRYDWGLLSGWMEHHRP